MKFLYGALTAATTLVLSYIYWPKLVTWFWATEIERTTPMTEREWARK